ncbi:class I SAM-dependent DNA methyltransferase [Arthrobacter sp. AFG20]|uniref:type I restriction-modification system subunit M n=1 Tax=Arthrobacter sp. AFG20 TaxID=1688671 RepID=UPI000C9E40D1|nr:class I SAM-dependent DNA methyltransferase [Arthrobacter sp. AFG20]PNH79224.1 restriction endonuclease subunit M [Arthrobacter sp. AFG20]
MTKPDAAFVWGIADLLRGPFKPNEYGTVILPFTVLARLDAVLAPTKDKVLAALPSTDGQPDLLKNRILTRASGQKFYNTSQYTLTALGDPNNLADNLENYIEGFDEDTREIFTDLDMFRFQEVIDKLAKHELLGQVVDRFSQVDVHPDTVSNFEMGQLFEDLIRRFMESSKEEAGEFFTPREVIQLMVNLLLTPDSEDLSNPHNLRQVYDPTCGTGGMLSVADEWVHKHNPDARLVLAGQEINGRTYAIAKADMLIKGQDVSNIKHGNTLTKDLLEGRTFSYALSNPPFGVDWKQNEAAVKAEKERDGEDSRFAAGLPPVSDGALLFLQHLVHKLRPAREGGGRGAIVLNGSPLFTGGAGSGPSEIRRWLIESDMVEAIVGLPTDMFYNTGIATYIWILTTKKAPERAGHIQLIDATGMWVKMRKSLGAKRRMLSEENIKTITRLMGDYEEADPSVSKIMANEDLGYRTITVERPLRQIFQVTPEKADAALASTAIAKLPDDEQETVRIVLKCLNPEMVHPNEKSFRAALQAAERTVGATITTAVRNALVKAVAVPSPDGDVVTDSRGNPVPDPKLRDTETMSLNEDVDSYVAREVLPWAPDAWVPNPEGTIGYEAPFTRLFYTYQQPRPLAEIDADVQAAILKVEALFAEVKA